MSCALLVVSLMWIYCSYEIYICLLLLKLFKKNKTEILELYKATWCLNVYIIIEHSQIAVFIIIDFHVLRVMIWIILYHTTLAYRSISLIIFKVYGDMDNVNKLDPFWKAWGGGQVNFIIAFDECITWPIMIMSQP